ncbi:MAG: phosphodiesterase [Planctomycetaceae bacterium]|nr:phosphodiesterase [Planctomycetaceae bacterium]
MPQSRTCIHSFSGTRAFLALATLLAIWTGAHLATTKVYAGDRPATGQSPPVSRILFGSCAKQDKPIPIFDTILAQSPDLFVFLGDNIYADTTDIALMKTKYARLAAHPSFARLVNFCPIMATWDDHDYGANDAGADYPQRGASEKLFLDFWQAPADSPRRQRPGIYTSQRFGPPGKCLQVIVLDTRFFRGPLRRGKRRVGGPYYPETNPQVTMLGKSQWRWLEQQLRQPAEIRIIASSIQCVAEAAGQETWCNLPNERKRLFALLRATRVNGVVFISGDRHWAELSVSDNAASYPIYDLTSSSFNQRHQRGTPTANRYRALPMTFHQENFGAIQVDWDQPDPLITLRIHDMQATVQLEQSVPLSKLQVR